MIEELKAAYNSKAWKLYVDKMDLEEVLDRYTVLERQGKVGRNK